MSKPTLLFYTPHPVPWSAALPQLCALRALRLRTLEEADLDRTLLSLSQGLRPAQPPAPGASLPEPLMILCGLSQGQLDSLLRALRQQEITCLKAVLTPTNAAWTLRTLYGELVRERLRLS